MKIKKLVMTGVLALSCATFAFADGETPIGNLTDPPPPPVSIVQVIINLLTGG